MHKRLSLRLIGFLVLVLLFIGCIFQCSSFAFGQNKIIYGTLTDNRDHQSYKTVSIGNQIWMAENLNFKTPYSFCYDDSTSNCTKYGRLYKLYEAVAACPDGWRLPTLEDWNTLLFSIGGEFVAGKKLKSLKGWLAREMVQIIMVFLYYLRDFDMKMVLIAMKDFILFSMHTITVQVMCMA